MLNQTFIQLSKIKRPEGARPSASPDLTEMAASILALGGLLRPLLLIRQGFSYQLFPGAGEEKRYWAAVLAAEMGAPGQAQLVNAVIISEAGVAQAQAQIETSEPSCADVVGPDGTNMALLALASRMAKIERQL